MDRQQIIGLATRLRRSTTNQDILTLCEYVLQPSGLAPEEQAAELHEAYRAYMRDYMRRYRARSKTA